MSDPYAVYVFVVYVRDKKGSEAIANVWTTAAAAWKFAESMLPYGIYKVKRVKLFTGDDASVDPQRGRRNSDGVAFDDIAELKAHKAARLAERKKLKAAGKKLPPLSDDGYFDDEDEVVIKSDGVNENPRDNNDDGDGMDKDDDGDGEAEEEVQPDVKPVEDSKPKSVVERKKPAATKPKPATKSDSTDRKSIPQGKVDSLKGLKLLFTGTFDSMDRKTCEATAKTYGAQVIAKLEDTDYIVLGTRAGQKKLDTIEELGLETITETEFFEMLEKGVSVEKRKEIEEREAEGPTKKKAKR